MAKPVKFYADIKDGEINFLSPEWVRTKMNELEDGKYTIVIEKYFNQRSSNQNRYLHGIVIPLVYQGLRDAGFEDVRDVDDAKFIIKNLFLKQKITNGVETFELVKDTHELTTAEMVKFIDEVTMWAAQYLSINIPAPNTQLTFI